MPWYPSETIAKVLKVTPRHVNRMADQGVIPKPNEDEKYDLVPCVQAYIEFLRMRHGGSRSAKSAQKFSAERARLYEMKADIAEVERARLTGDLVSAEEVEAVWTDMIAVAKVRMLAIPSKMAPRLALISSPTKIRELLDSELSAALGELAAGAEVEVDPGLQSARRRNGARHAKSVVAATEADG
jgi:phage terminase Nu1 subunit (DNA packaging protein)